MVLKTKECFNGEPNKKLIERLENSTQSIKADVSLSKGKKVVLRADTEKHKRGLVVEWLEDGGYDVYY